MKKTPASPDRNQPPGHHRAPGNHSFGPIPKHYVPGDRRTIALSPGCTVPPLTSDRQDAPIVATVGLMRRPGLPAPGR